MIDNSDTIPHVEMSNHQPLMVPVSDMMIEVAEAFDREHLLTPYPSLPLQADNL
jgi:hypothetical protein